MNSSICITSSSSSADLSVRVRTFATSWSSFTVVYLFDKDNDIYTKYDFSKSMSVDDIIEKFSNNWCSFCLFEEGTYNMWTGVSPAHHYMKDGDSIAFANTLIEYV
ncbi:MAG: hypothetical protein EBU84_11730 [Actinobacteria bacterium]|nr:hypothetical protein [Actinomycetota bacterium]